MNGKLECDFWGELNFITLLYPMRTDEESILDVPREDGARNSG